MASDDELDELKREIRVLERKLHRCQVNRARLEDHKEASEAVHRRVIFEMAETQQRLRKSEVAAQHASRAKSEFLANVSHEIRTPLNGFLGMARLLFETDLSPTQRRLARKVVLSGDTLLRLIDDVLDFSKIEAGHLKLEQTTFELTELVEDAAAVFAERAEEKQVELSCELPRQRLLLGDPFRLRQILTNLIGNAVKFTDSGSVRARVSLHAAEASTELRVEVRDTGIGFDSDTAKSLFHVFQQADGSTTRRYGGTGLGLAIVRELVEHMGGEVGATGELGQGATFWFRVPVQDAGPPPAVRPRRLVTRTNFDGFSPRHAAACAGMRVLVVEDNEINREVAAGFLGTLGCNVESVADGAEAVSIVQRNRYDLVLMDCQMPVMDGFEAAARIRQLPPQRGGMVPIVALTANVLRDERMRCIDVGMNGFLSKPFTVAQLRETLQRWAVGE